MTHIARLHRFSVIVRMWVLATWRTTRLWNHLWSQTKQLTMRDTFPAVASECRWDLYKMQLVKTAFRVDNPLQCVNLDVLYHKNSDAESNACDHLARSGNNTHQSLRVGATCDNFRLRCSTPCLANLGESGSIDGVPPSSS